MLLESRLAGRGRLLRAQAALLTPAQRLRQARGPYTSLVVQNKKALGWWLHLERLAQSLRYISSEAGSGSWWEGRDLLRNFEQSASLIDCLDTQLGPAVAEAVAEVSKHNKKTTSFSVLLHLRGLDPAARSWRSGQLPLNVYAEASPLQLNYSLAKVACLVGSRKNALTKDSQWAVDRQALEQRVPEGFAECMLCSPVGEVLEGFITNIFVVRGTGDSVEVQTAGRGVLLGIMRQFVVEACRELGIPVKLEPPRLSESFEWTEAFLTNCRRYVQPVCLLHSVDATLDLRDIEFACVPGPVTMLIQGRLEQLISRHPSNKDVPASNKDVPV